MNGRFVKGQSGNPNGRPKARRPNVSAFDIIFDKTIMVSQGGVERELAVDEVLELQTHQAALKGSRMAIRQVLKMIEKREVALAKVRPQLGQKPIDCRLEGDPRNADEAMLLLGITVEDPSWGGGCEYGTRMKLATWATQAGLSRPGRRKLDNRNVQEIKRCTLDPDKLKWPRTYIGD